MTSKQAPIDSGFDAQTTAREADIAWTVAADSKVTSGVRPWATDPELAERLWTLSEGLTEVPFRF